MENDFLNMSDFDIDYSTPQNCGSKSRIKKEVKTTMQIEHVKKIKYKEVVLKSAGSFKDIVGTKLEKGVQYRFVTNKAFNAVSVLQHISDNHNIEEIYIVVYRMNNKAYDLLVEMMDSKKIKSTFIISTFFRNNKKYERWVNQLKHRSKNKNTKLAFTTNHAKIFMAKTKDNKHIVFEGSGNLSDNARIEQYIYEDNKNVYDFHAKWINELIEKLKITENKSDL